MSSNSGKMMVNKVSPAEQMVQMAEKQLKKKHRGVYKRKNPHPEFIHQNDVEWVASEKPRKEKQ